MTAERGPQDFDVSQEDVRKLLRGLGHLLARPQNRQNYYEGSDGSGEKRLLSCILGITSTLTAASAPTNHTVRSTAGLGTPVTLTSPTTTVTVSGGAPGYTYAWSFISGGSSIVINAPAAASTTFSSTGTGGKSRTGTVRCTVTDTLGITAYADVTLKFIFASPIF